MPDQESKTKDDHQEIILRQLIAMWPQLRPEVRDAICLLVDAELIKEALASEGRSLSGE
ncbi:MAG: hypothetical protein KDB27_27505 [Planctomycetales bacterium]|nr:hypothetical protein [Planctomycetales bacterium]